MRRQKISHRWGHTEGELPGHHPTWCIGPPSTAAPPVDRLEQAAARAHLRSWPPQVQRPPSRDRLPAEAQPVVLVGPG